MSYSLLIVESPAKCKKIESFLGPKFKCRASIGHFRLLNSLEQIDLSNMNVSYKVSPDKKKNLTELKKLISESSEVILATDNDREGEAIAWHICDYFKLPVTKTKRILFQEITKSAIMEALNNPSKINMDLVKAQQTRQILDLLVGYKVSPILWKYISAQYEKNLSAGRCQTPALRLIYDNLLDNQNKVAKLLFVIKGLFTDKNIIFTLDKTWSESDQNEIEPFYKKCMDYPFTILVNKPKILIQNPPLPFDTSTLQQTSSNELHYSPKQTMKYAQELYENGYITYMRTDQKKYAKEFLDVAIKYIGTNYGNEYVSSAIEKLTNVSEKKEEAHEAIRPIKLETIELDTERSPQAKKLYYLIHSRTLESCMEKSKINFINSEIKTEEGYIFKNRSEQFKFLGWRIVRSKDDNLTSEIYKYLLNLKEGSPVSLHKLYSDISIKDGGSHISEAQLVSLLEKKGIGRPSTFSSLVDKIQERDYVKKEDVKAKELQVNEFIMENKKIAVNKINKKVGGEKNKLILTIIGRKVIEFLSENFEEIFYYDFTKKMEDELDLVSKGQMAKIDMCNSINEKLTLLIDKKFQKQDEEIDVNHKIVMGKHGAVIKKTENGKTSFIGIPSGTIIEDLKSGKISISQLDIKADFSITNGKETALIKKGKYGYYAVKGEKKISLKDWEDDTINTIKWEDLNKAAEEKTTESYNRFITNDLSIRKSKYGFYLYHKTKVMKKPQFYKINSFQGDISNAELDEVKNWIRETYSNLQI